MPIQQMLLGAGGAPDEPPGQVLMEFTGTRSTNDTGNSQSHTWTAGVGVTSISILVIGGGGGGNVKGAGAGAGTTLRDNCLLYTSQSPRD